MPLNNSGPISLGGATVGQSINLELGKAATALASINAADFRALAGVPTGLIRLSDFYGKSSISYWFATFGAGSPSGNRVLTDVLGGPAMAVTSSGTVYGFFSASSDQDPVFFKLNPNGTVAFQTRVNAANSSSPPQTIFLTPSETVYINILFDVSGIGQQGTLQTFNSSGTALTGFRTTNADGLDNPFFQAAVREPSTGNLYAAGGLFASRFALIKYNSAGAAIFGRRASGSFQVNRVMLDGAENPHIFGTPSGSRSTVVKFNSSGTFQWGAQLQSNSNGTGAVAPSGNVYLAGVGSPDGGSNNFFYIARLNSSGSLVWQRRLNVTGFFMNSGQISFDSSENIYLTGANGYSLILKYNSSGVLQWQRNLNGFTNTPSINTSIPDVMQIIADRDGLGIVAQLPTDGSKTGTYGGISYTATSFVESAGDRTVNSASFSFESVTPVSATQNPTSTASAFPTTFTAVP